jgi:hypothetical protein
MEIHDPIAVLCVIALIGLVPILFFQIGGAFTGHWAMHATGYPLTLWTWIPVACATLVILDALGVVTI